MGKKGGGIFASWLKQFTTMVFLQSFHAVFLMMILKFLSAISGDNVTSAISGADKSEMSFAEKGNMMGIVCIVGMVALLKFEKLLKNLFGVEDSKLIGGIGDNLTRSLGTIHSGISLYKRTREPADRLKQLSKDEKEAKKVTSKALTRYNRAKETQSFYNEQEEESTVPQLVSAPSATQNDSSQQDANSNSSSRQTSIITGQEAEEAWKNRGKETNKTGSGTSTGGSDEAIRRLVAALENNTNALTNNTSTVASNGSGGSGSANNRISAGEAKMKSNWEVEDARKELEEAQEKEAKIARDKEIAKKQKYTRLMTTVAAGAMGVGGTENFGDAVTFANLADMPMDWATDRMAEKTVNLDFADKYNKLAKENHDKFVDAQTKAMQAAAAATADPKNTDKKKAAAQAKVEEEMLRKQEETMSKIANTFFNDVPTSLVQSLRDGWKEAAEEVDMVNIRSDKVKNAKGVKAKVKASFDTTPNRMMRDSVKRKPQSIDYLDR